MKKVIGLLLLVSIVFGLQINEVPKRVVLDGKNGSRVDGKAFDTAMIRGKTYLFVYSDPDKRELNEKFFELIQQKNFDRDRYNSIAVVNMAATWMPNFLLQAILKSKQKKYPHTIYVKDNEKVFVKEWGMADNSQNILIFDSKGRVRFFKSGKLTKKDQEKALAILQKLVNGK